MLRNQNITRNLCYCFFSYFMEGNIVRKESTHSINNKMKLYILGVLMNKLGN